MDVSMFFAENAAKIEHIKYVVSDRFKDENGNPAEWELAPVSCAVDAKIKQKCLVKGKFDNAKYTEEMVAASVIEPNLNDARLQDSYHAFNPAQLLERMLTSGEMNRLTLKVLEVNGLSEPMNDLIEQAKN